MARCAATAKGTGQRCRRPAAPGDDRCRQHRAAPADVGPDGAEPAARAAIASLYEDCFADEEVRAALDRAVAAGLDQETALLRVLIRRALIEGHPATQVACLVDCLTRLVKTQHVLSGKSAQSLDEALSVALDAVATQVGVLL